MVGKWVRLSLVAAALAAGCGQGTLGFDVDVYSWLKGTGKDTLPYAAPAATSIDTANTPQKISLLPGAGSSFVDTVRISGTMDLINQSGAGTLALQIYLAADSAGTYSASAGVFNPKPSASVSGTNTSVLTFAVPNLAARLDSLFTKSEVWVRLQASVSNPGVTTLQGKAVLSGLQVRAVVQDKLF